MRNEFSDLVVSGRYLIKEGIDGGSNGTVYTIMELPQTEISDRFVIKISLFPKIFGVDRSTNVEFMQRNATQQSIANRRRNEIIHTILFNHPHLNRSVEGGSVVLNNSRYAYLILEKAEYNLQSYIDKCGVLKGDDYLKVFKHIASGLVFLHGFNLLHRDIKPANILFRNGKWEIGDFGLIRETGEHTLKTRASVRFVTCPQVLGQASGQRKMTSIVLV